MESTEAKVQGERPFEKLLILKKPLVVGGTTYESLVLREPRAGELERATDRNPAGMKLAIDLLTMVAGVPRQVIESLPGSKLREASAYLEGFSDDEESETLSGERDDEYRLSLGVPIVLGRESYDSLTLREPTAGELERATAKNPPPMKVAIDLMAMVTGVPRKVIEAVPGSKFREASRYLEGFTGDGPPNGEEASQK